MRHIFQIAIAMCLCIGTSFSYGEELRMEQSCVCIDAELCSCAYEATHEFGNKHRRILELASLVRESGLDGVEIPIPRGLASSKVVDYLETKHPEIIAQWKNIGAQFTKHQSNQDEEFFLDVPEVKLQLEELQTAIRVAITSAGDDLAALDALGIDDDFISWLKALTRDEQYLMVRSSGDEDTKKLANAGGNVSVAYVTPSIKDVMQASGDVVASYFGYLSLKNRILADMNPFEQPLKLSVTIQQLIGEKVGGEKSPDKVPISLVLFTNEPNYIDDPDMRVMRISATYGHGEGVVGNLGIATETILLIPSRSRPGELIIVYDNRDKPERLVPVRDEGGNVKLDILDNDKDLRWRRVFDEDMLKRLYELGLKTEAFYGGHPTDMEIVVRDGTIYPVQARPVNRPEAHPTYLDFVALGKLGTEASPVLTRMQGKTLVSGLSEVLILDNLKALLIADTLEDAELAFRPGLHKAVAVFKDEPANSHPVVNFSGMGIPSFFFSDKDILMKSLEGKGNLVIDSQQGTLVLWDIAKDDVANYIEEGYAHHPAPIYFSLNVAHPKRAIPVDGDEGAYSDALDILRQLSDTDDTKLSADLVHELRTLPNVAAVFESGDERIADLKSTNNNLASYFAETLSQYRTSLRQAFGELEERVTNPNASRLERLLHVKILGTLLVGNPTQVVGLHQYALDDMTELTERSDQLLGYVDGLGGFSCFSDLFISRYAPSQEIGEQWDSFIESLDRSLCANDERPAEAARFLEIVDTVQRQGILPLWLAMNYNVVAQNESLTALNLLLGGFDEDTEASIGRLEVIRGRIKRLERQQSLFANESTVADAHKELKMLVEVFTKIDDSQSVVSLTQQGSPMVDVVAVATLGEFIDVFDASIKAMKGSASIDPDTRAEYMKEMLQDYLSLLKTWFPLSLKEAYSDDRLEPYMSDLELILEQMPIDASQLRPTPGFQVDAALFGSHAILPQAPPQTLEDVFTLIHQNLLDVLGFKVNMLSESLEIPLPELFVSMQESLLTLAPRDTAELGEDAPKMHPRLIGRSYTRSGITHHFSMPLGQHSSSFSIGMSKDDESLVVVVKFYGYVSESRWGDIITMALLTQLSERLDLSEIYQKDALTQFTWMVSSQQQVEWAREAYAHMLQHSFSESWLEESISQYSQQLLEEALSKSKLSRKELVERLLEKVSVKYTMHQLIPFLEDDVAGNVTETISMLRDQARARHDNTTVIKLTAGLYELGGIDITDVRETLSSVITQVTEEEKIAVAEAVLGLCWYFYDDRPMLGQLAPLAHELISFPGLYMPYLAVSLVRAGWDQGTVPFDYVQQILDQSLELADEYGLYKLFGFVDELIEQGEPVHDVLIERVNAKRADLGANQPRD